MAERRALIVATGTYSDPKLRRLRAPAADADRLAAVLSDPAVGDFQVDIALDEPEPLLRRRIARFFASTRRDDVLLMHLSCHGVKDPHGGLYLAASDTEMDLLDATAIPARWLDEQLSHSPSRQKLLLLDCCFSGKFPLGATARAGETIEVHERFEGRGRAVITASNAMEYAYEGDDLSGDGQPSYFTAALVDALSTGEADRDQDHWISVDELYDYVFERVRDASPSQTPTRQVALEGPLFVARSSWRRPVEPASLDESVTDAMEHPLAAVRAGAAEELGRLLRSQNPGVALAARNALERLSDDDSQKVCSQAKAYLEPTELVAADAIATTADVMTEPAASASPPAPRVPEPSRQDSPEAGPDSKDPWPAYRVGVPAAIVLVTSFLFSLGGFGGNLTSAANAIIWLSLAGLAWAAVQARRTRRHGPRVQRSTRSTN